MKKINKTDGAKNIFKELDGEAIKKNGYLIFKNLFLVKFPKEFNIESTDVISVEFIDNEICRFIIKNNFINFPLFSLNKYSKKCCSFFCRKNDSIVIDYLNRNGEKQYSARLTKVRIRNIKEDILTYYNDEPHTITVDIKFSKRILEKQ